MTYEESREVEIANLMKFLDEAADYAVIIDVDEYSGTITKSVYLGTFMALDPCGRYHHTIAPNLVTQNCLDYWENLDAAADRLDGYISSGEGDPCDIYFTYTQEE